MDITLDINKNKWLLDIKGATKKYSYNKRYRDKKHILEIIDNLSSPYGVIIGHKDAKLLYVGYTIILKNYRKYKKRFLYKLVTSKFNNETTIVNVTSANIDKIKKVLKKTLINSKIGGLILTSIVSSGIMVASEVYKSNKTNNIEATVLNIDNPKILDESELVSIKIEPNFSELSMMSLDNRIEETETVQYLENGGNFNVGSKLNDYTFNKMVTFYEENGSMFETAYLKYGIDPYLLLAMSMTETSLEYQRFVAGTDNNSSAVGPMQIEKSHLGTTVTAYNYQINDMESVVISDENLFNIKSNIELGAMMLQNHLEQYNNNIFLAVQAHNYGSTAMNIVISRYAEEIGKTKEEVMSNMTDFGWMKYVDDIHKNPQKYIPNWKYETFGNNQYLYRVMGYYIGKNLINNSKDYYYVYNLSTNTCIKEAKDDLNLSLGKSR